MGLCHITSEGMVINTLHFGTFLWYVWAPLCFLWVAVLFACHWPPKRVRFMLCTWWMELGSYLHMQDLTVSITQCSEIKKPAQQTRCLCVCIGMPFCSQRTTRLACTSDAPNSLLGTMSPMPFDISSLFPFHVSVLWLDDKCDRLEVVGGGWVSIHHSLYF